MRKWFMVLWLILRSEIGRDEIYLTIALGLIASGFWQWWRPGAFLVPGLVMIALWAWMAAPDRNV